jgi:hypothetical protein
MFSIIATLCIASVALAFEFEIARVFGRKALALAPIRL